MQRSENGVDVEFLDNDGNLRQEHYEYLLVTTGRRPNFDKLQIDKSGLVIDDRGVPVFNASTMQCGDSHIFIAGDANDQLPLLHEASDEGRIAGANAARFPEIQEGHRRSPLNVVFCDLRWL